MVFPLFFLHSLRCWFLLLGAAAQCEGAPKVPFSLPLSSKEAQVHSRHSIVASSTRALPTARARTRFPRSLGEREGNVAFQRLPRPCSLAPGWEGRCALLPGAPLPLAWGFRPYSGPGSQRRVCCTSRSVAGSREQALSCPLAGDRCIWTGAWGREDQPVARPWSEQPESFPQRGRISFPACCTRSALGWARGLLRQRSVVQPGKGCGTSE